MKWIYGIIIGICTIFLIIIYFTNIIYTGGYPLFLGSRDNQISMAAGLGLIILISIILGFTIALLLKSIVNQKPKDFDDFDL